MMHGAQENHIMVDIHYSIVNFNKIIQFFNNALRRTFSEYLSWTIPNFGHITYFQMSSRKDFAMDFDEYSIHAISSQYT